MTTTEIKKFYTVKTLKFKELGNGEWETHTPFGVYNITFEPNGYGTNVFWITFNNIIIADFHALSYAKEGIQSDFEKRIKECLTSY